jgi:hypothetical protein
MNARFTAPIRTRITAIAAAVLTSTLVLGATVAGMQSGVGDSNLAIVALERVVVTAPSVH